jgi:hypothetical protein
MPEMSDRERATRLYAQLRQELATEAAALDAVLLVTPTDPAARVLCWRAYHHACIEADFTRKELANLASNYEPDPRDPTRNRWARTLPEGNPHE